MNPPFTPQYLERQNEMLKQVFAQDCKVLNHKEQTYKGSWRQRGGSGAFFVTARKWDRLENIAQAGGYDIFKILQEEDDKGKSGDDGSLLAEIRDLRRYLALIETQILMSKQIYQQEHRHANNPEPKRLDSLCG